MSFGGRGGGGVAARSGSCCWCSAFWSAVAAGDTDGLVGFVRVQGLLVGVSARGRGCQ